MAKKRCNTKKPKGNQKQKVITDCRIKILIGLAMLTTICTIVFAGRVLRYNLDLEVSKRELEALPVLPQISQTPQSSPGVWSTLSLYDNKMRKINPDYAGVLMIDDTAITYPVVRGTDNIKYLNTSFEGTENLFGTLFMDYRCVGGEIPHIIIYGHHVGDTDGSRYLFGGLDGLLDEQNKAKHKVITFIENDCLSEFEICSVRVTDINDPAYQLDFSSQGSFETFLERNGAPADATQVLTLSTCFGSGNNDKRIIVQGVRKNISKVDKNQTMIIEYEESPSK